MKMPFGAYEGRQLQELPNTYLRWLATSEPLHTALLSEIDRRRADLLRSMMMITKNYV